MEGENLAYMLLRSISVRADIDSVVRTALEKELGDSWMTVAREVLGNAGDEDALGGRVWVWLREMSHCGFDTWIAQESAGLYTIRCKDSESLHLSNPSTGTGTLTPRSGTNQSDHMRVLLLPNASCYRTDCSCSGLDSVLFKKSWTLECMR